MSAVIERDSYCALRVCPKASAPAWWAAARARSDTPAAIWALMAGRTRVELTGEAAAQVLAWAEGVDGWAAADPKPLFIHRPGGAAS